jgi:hypothetical protein
VKEFMRCALLLLLVSGLSGCALTDFLTGTKRDDKGNVITATDPGAGPLDTLLTLVGQVWKPALLAAGAVRWGTVEYRHWQIVKDGGKDDDNDGNPDPPVVTPPLAPPAPPIA